MPSNYMVSKFKGKYRLLPELCMNTHDFPRYPSGEIDDDAEVYIKCGYGNKITYYGLNESRRGVLIAYIPSRQRGRNIKKELKKQGIDIFDYDESDEEAMFHFLATDIEPVATLMKASTFGANISPWSSRNLPKNKYIVIPEDEIARYKEIIGRLDKSDSLIIKKVNSEFMDEILAKKLRPKGTRKPYDYKSEMKSLKLSRQMKEYIWHKDMWEDYLAFIDDKITECCSNK